MTFEQQVAESLGNVGFKKEARHRGLVVPVWHTIESLDREKGGEAKNGLIWKSDPLGNQRVGIETADSCTEMGARKEIVDEKEGRRH